MIICDQTYRILVPLNYFVEIFIMAFAKELIDTLKKELRLHHITYVDIGKLLDLSESSIKRLFSEADMSLSRLEKICDVIGTDIAQLAEKANKARRHVLELSYEKEKELVNDEKLLMIGVHLIYGWSYDMILEKYHIDIHEGQRYLTRLDSMGIIELLAENRVRIILSPNFQWIKDGPIQQFFENQVQSEFFTSHFTNKGELRLVVNGWMSINSIQVFHDNIHRLAKEFEQHKDNDKTIPIEKKHGTTMVIAIRPWTLNVFEKHSKYAKKGGDGQ